MSDATHPVDELLPAPKLFTLGLQHVLVMYAGAIAVPLIIGRALKLEPADVAFLISADLFTCGIVTLIQSLGATQWFGVRLPVMMGVTFAAVQPMQVMASANGGPEGRGEAVAVSSTEEACCSVRLARSSAAWLISVEPAFMLSVLVAIWRIASCSLAMAPLKSSFSLTYSAVKWSSIR